MRVERVSAAPAAVAEPRTIRVALAGCGTVGGGLLRLLHELRPALEAHHGVRFDVRAVLVRDATRLRAVPLEADVVTDDLDAFNATDADIVVEAIGGIAAAARIAIIALRRGASFVTANKALVAAHGPDMAALAQHTGAGFGYEAAVAGGVPVIRVLRDALPFASVRRIRGVLNGTTNFLLGRIAEGLSAAEALAEAQALGFAEADPTRDLNGQDAADKLAVLAWLAFGVHPAGAVGHRRGIEQDAERMVRAAAVVGGVVKLIAEAAPAAGGVTGTVEPVVVAADSVFGRTRAEQNVLVVDTTTNGSLVLAGPGAGGSPTATALLGDMLHLPHGTLPAVSRSATLDEAEHAWLVAAKATGYAGVERVASLVAAAGVPLTASRHVDGELVMLTRPCTRDRIDALETRLRSGGAAPVVLRAADEALRAS